MSDSRFAEDDFVPKDEVRDGCPVEDPDDIYPWRQEEMHG